MGGQRGHGGRPVPGEAAGEGVEGLGTRAEPVRVTADLVQRDQPGPAVERRVLHPLGQHGPAGLAESHDQLIPAAAGRRLVRRAVREVRHRPGARCRGLVVAQHQRGQHVQRGVLQLVGKLAASSRRGRLHLGHGGRRWRQPRCHVGPVDAEAGQQLDQDSAQVVLADAGQRRGGCLPGQPGQPADLRGERAGGRLPLGRVRDRAELAGRPVSRTYCSLSGLAPAESMNRSPTAPRASYPVVPAHCQSPGSSSAPVRIFSLTTQDPPVAVVSQRRYPAGSASPSGWSTRRPSMAPSASRPSSRP